MARRALLIVVGLVLVAALACAGAAAWSWSRLRAPYRGWDGSEVLVDLPEGSGARAMLRALGRAGVIREPRLARFAATFQGWDRELKPGEYRFDRPASMLEVLDRLRRGDVVLHAVTVPEGLTLDEIAARVVEAGLGTRETVLAAFRDPTPVRELDPLASDLEGYLFPDTYLFPRRETPHAIAGAMVKRFVEVTGAEYAARAHAIGLTPRRALVLASLIEKETALPAERPRISGVFHNRLRRDMLLQCDPTVLYALRRNGKTVATLRSADLVFPSPFNTYVTKGLPPGPICSPGKESLDAAVAPLATEEVYFVASPGNGGGHRFSKDLASHLEAVRALRLYERSSR